MQWASLLDLWSKENLLFASTFTFFFLFPLKLLSMDGFSFFCASRYTDNVLLISHSGESSSPAVVLRHFEILFGSLYALSMGVKAC